MKAFLLAGLIALLVLISGCIQQGTEDCGELTASNEQLTNTPEDVFFSNQVSCIQKAAETCKPAKLTILTDNSKVSFEIIGEGIPLKQQMSIDRSGTIGERDLPTCKVNMKMLGFSSYPDLEGLNASCNWIKNNYIINNPLDACEGPLIEGYKKHPQLIIDHYEGLLSTFAPDCTLNLACWNAMLKKCIPALMAGDGGYTQIIGGHVEKCLTIRYIIALEIFDTPLLSEYCEYKNGELIECKDLRPEITIKEIDPLNPATWK